MSASIKPNWPVKCDFFRLHCAYDTLHGNWTWAASLGRVKCSLNAHKMCPVYTGGPLRSVQTAAHYVYARWTQWKYLLQQIAVAVVVVKCRLQGCKAWHFVVPSLNIDEENLLPNSNSKWKFHFVYRLPFILYTAAIDWLKCLLPIDWWYAARRATCAIRFA